MEELNESSEGYMAFQPDMAEILDSFIVESKEIMETLSSDLMALESRSEDSELHNTIFRAVHTLKGTSSFLGFQQFTELSHHFEDVLNALRRSIIRVTPTHLDYMFVVYDLLKEMLDDIEQRSIRVRKLDEVFATLKMLSDPNSAANCVVDHAPAVHDNHDELDVPPVIDVESVADSIPVRPLNEAEQLDRERALAEARASLDALLATKAQATAVAETEIPSVVAASADTTGDAINTEAPQSHHAPAVPISENTTSARPATNADAGLVSTQTKSPEAAQVRSVDSTIRVDVQKLDMLMNLVGELVLGRNRFSQLVQSLSAEFSSHPMVKELLDTSTHIDFITTELQTAVMKTRMVSMAKIYNKLPRLVRDLCKEMNKEIDLVCSGEETELDKTLIEELNDPFIHLLRNAADHGVESPDEREAAGKPRRGTITVRAIHAGNHIAISISDDGKGMDPEKLKSVALSRGVITEAEAASMSDQDAFKLIFMPGFSTAKTITNVSGRGVGMDVVKTNILKLKGSISIESHVGVGSVFTIKLPLTLAIIQTLLVQVKSEIYSIPLESVVEVVRLTRKDIQTIQSKETTLLRGNVLPLIRLQDVMQHDEAADREAEVLHTVVVHAGDQKVGLVVDQLLGQREIVIKSLGSAFENVRCVSGSTILGDGRVIMIIDVAEVIHYCTEKSGELV